MLARSRENSDFWSRLRGILKVYAREMTTAGFRPSPNVTEDFDDKGCPEIRGEEKTLAVVFGQESRSYLANLP
jgi:hypothetical protein